MWETKEIRLSGGDSLGSRAPVGCWRRWECICDRRCARVCPLANTPDVRVWQMLQRRRYSLLRERYSCCRGDFETPDAISFWNGWEKGNLFSTSRSLVGALTGKVHRCTGRQGQGASTVHFGRELLRKKLNFFPFLYWFKCFIYCNQGDQETR